MTGRISNIAGRLAAKIIRRLPVRTTRKLIRIKVVAPFYHLVSDEENSLTKHLYAHRSIKTFNDDIRFYKQNFNIIGLQDLINHVNEGAKLPKNALFLSFDDGFKEIYHVVAPILDEQKVPATFFINNDFLDNKDMFYRGKASLLIETIKHLDFISRETQNLLKQKGIDLFNLSNSLKMIPYSKRDILDEVAESVNLSYNEYLQQHQPYLTSGQVEELIGAGFTFGGHSLDHPLYRMSSPEEQFRQTKESVEQIAKQFKLKYKAFAFPFTEVGVSKDFFKQANRTNLFDISFGTRGLVHDPLPNLMQRFGLEGGDFDKSAPEVMQRNYGITCTRLFERTAFR